MTVDRILLVVASAKTRERLREALGVPPVATTVVTDRWGALGALRAEDFAVVVVGPDADAADVATLVDDTSEGSLVVHVAPPEDLAGALDRLGRAVYDVVPDADSHRWLGPAVRRALEHRRLRLLAELQEKTQGLLRIVDPEQLPPAIARVAREVTGADDAAFVVRGPEGTDVHRVGGGTGLPPDKLLVRRSERMEREPPTGATVVDGLGDAHAVAVVMGHERVHGVLWILRSKARRPFAAREIEALAAVEARAFVAADHLRLVRDLQHRLAAMDATRRRLEDDGRAAQVGRLAVDALHALRAPLAYTRTNLRQVEASGELAPGSVAATHLGYALEGLARADKAVEDLSRVSQGRDRVPIEVRQLVEAALSLARPLRVAEAVDVSENAVILGNVGRLSQALAEVIRNADQAEGSSRVDVKASRIGDEVAIEIADDGEGIPAALLPRVTEPFFSTRGRPGLGLSTCRDAVEQSGGTLEIWSRRGVGTIVRVQLPGEQVDDELEIAGEVDGEE